MHPIALHSLTKFPRVTVLTIPRTPVGFLLFRLILHPIAVLSLTQAPRMLEIHIALHRTFLSSTISVPPWI